MKIEGYEEITVEEYWEQEESFKFINDVTRETHYFKKKQIFPIKMETKEGSVEIDFDGGIRLFGGYGGSEYIGSTELEQFQNIIKKAKEVRDGSCRH